MQLPWPSTTIGCWPKMVFEIGPSTRIQIWYIARIWILTLMDQHWLELILKSMEALSPEHFSPNEIYFSFGWTAITFIRGYASTSAVLLVFSHWPSNEWCHIWTTIPISQKLYVNLSTKIKFWRFWTKIQNSFERLEKHSFNDWWKLVIGFRNNFFVFFFYIHHTWS